MSFDFWGSIMYVRKTYGRMLESVCRKWGLNRAEMDVLLFLANNTGRDRAADIVGLRGLTKSHVSVAVKSLCDCGLLQASQDENDRRVLRLRPTEKAEPIILEGRQSQQTYIQHLFGNFSEEEWQTFCTLNEKLIENVKTLRFEE